MGVFKLNNRFKHRLAANIRGKTMALKDLSVEAMLTVSERILNPPANRPQTDNKDELYSGLLVLRRAHEHLLKVNHREGEVQAQITQLTAKLTELDTIHDRCSRGIHRALNAIIDINDDPQKTAEYQRIMDTLHPNGLSVNVISYAEQAGNTMRVAERITPEIRQLLASTILVGVSLETVLDRWLDAGKELGRLQAERDTLNTDQDPDRITPATVLDARNQWIRATNAFVAALESTDFTQSEKTAILAHLHAVESQATARRLNQKEADAKTPTTDDATNPTEEPSHA